MSTLAPAPAKPKPRKNAEPCGSCFTTGVGRGFDGSFLLNKKCVVCRGKGWV